MSRVRAGRCGPLRSLVQAAPLGRVGPAPCEARQPARQQTQLESPVQLQLHHAVVAARAKGDGPVVSRPVCLVCLVRPTVGCLESCLAFVRGMSGYSVLIGRLVTPRGNFRKGAKGERI